MKQLIYTLVLGIVLISCSALEDKNEQLNYAFITSYSDTVTVGGVVGTTEKTFEKGAVFSGIDDGGPTIRIRIAEHTKRNEDCPNSWCYQEFLDVPRELIKRID
ncbi:hypothetical protein [Leeuwenhoekiella sp. MAR_2009_132]|uniref:hypothetical protein n=1 Tax=Leeuwenhoekiella sp. MAR_2009_132 TaxID=1392489 RepID=UPI00048E051A|nr:hypothetical protein [Leeuwenhoekiella sp. MAR_2009_132]